MFNIIMLKEIVSHFAPQNLAIVYGHYCVTVSINDSYMNHIIYMNFDKNKFVINIDGYDKFAIHVDDELDCIYSIVDCLGDKLFDDYDKYIMENEEHPDPDYFVEDGISVDDAHIGEVEMDACLHFSCFVIDHFYNVFGRMPKVFGYIMPNTHVDVDELPF